MQRMLDAGVRNCISNAESSSVNQRRFLAGAGDGHRPLQIVASPPPLKKITVRCD